MILNLTQTRNPLMPQNCSIYTWANYMQIRQLVLLELEIIINFLKREQIIMKPKTCFIGTQIEFLDQFNYDVSFPWLDIFHLLLEAQFLQKACFCLTIELLEFFWQQNALVLKSGDCLLGCSERSKLPAHKKFWAYTNYCKSDCYFKSHSLDSTKTRVIFSRALGMRFCWFCYLRKAAKIKLSNLLNHSSLYILFHFAQKDTG